MTRIDTVYRHFEEKSSLFSLISEAASQSLKVGDEFQGLLLNKDKRLTEITQWKALFSLTWKHMAIDRRNPTNMCCTFYKTLTRAGSKAIPLLTVKVKGRAAINTRTMERCKEVHSDKTQDLLIPTLPHKRFWWGKTDMPWPWWTVWPRAERAEN